ncbi:MAG: hypothetical protein IKA36_01230 [Clostridia bacterium]|nr:hypothetical protein [Clostridia bacterium]
MEDLSIKYAIDFMNKMGYSWDGRITDTRIISTTNNDKPTTIEEFFQPIFIMLNNEEKAIIFYDECDDQPNCIIYNYKDGIFVIEKDLTNDWIEFLKGNNIKF